MKRFMVTLFVMLLILCYHISVAQINAGAFIGFKSLSLKAAGTITANGNMSATPVSDGGGTVFEFGGFFGYTAFTSGIYSLDLQFVPSYSSIGFYERGYNSQPGTGSGKFSADGWSGATTSVFEFGLLGLNRISIPSFKIIEPYAGAGLSFDIYSTSDLGYGPPANTGSGTVKGKSQFKMGIVLAYGAILHVTPILSPYIQLRHLIPFGSEIQLTDDPQWTTIIKDVPGYFSLNAGVRFDL